MKKLAPLLCLLLAACATPPAKSPPERVTLTATTFDALPGWREDNVSEALAPLEKSCAVAMRKTDDAPFGSGGLAGTVAQWRAACATLDPAATGDAARKYFEDTFTPFAISGNDGPDGLFTGYYQPMLRGSYKRVAPYLIPLYARPRDLVTVDLGKFKPDLKGQTITGRVDRNKDGDASLVPYFTRADIAEGALEDQPKVVFVDSAVDAFFLHIQGSGIVTMEDGKTVQVGYAAQNGRPYIAIGKELIKRGALAKDNVSMQSIRAWLETHPVDAPAVMNVNTSYVFFRPLRDGGPLGAQGVALTPGRSMAVDSKKIPYGAPVFLDAEDPDGGRIQKLMIAQDTGGAITGAVRGDYFWGAGAFAADKAGRMKSRGRDYILLPKGVTPEARERAEISTPPFNR